MKLHLLNVELQFQVHIFQLIFILKYLNNLYYHALKKYYYAYHTNKCIISMLH